MPAAPPPAPDRFALKLGLFYAAYFLFGGVQLPFFPLWLETRGLDPRMIGLIIAVPTLVRIVAAPVLGHLADRYAALKTTLVFVSVAAAMGMAAVGWLESGIAILIGVGIAAMFYGPLLSLTDAYALSGLPPRNIAYGPVRLWGSVAFIVGTAGAGALLGAISPAHLIWLVVGALTATAVAACALVPLGGARPLRSAGRAPLRALWQQPAFLAVVAAASLTQSSHALYYGFSTLDWRAAGFSGSTIGLLWGVGVLAEIVLFAVSPRLPRWLGSTLLLALGAAGGIVRWTVMALEPPLAALPALQVLHAASFGAAHLGAMGFLARAVPREAAASAQAALATASGLVMAGATALSGLLYATAGSRAYAAMAVVTGLGLVCALIARRLERLALTRLDTPDTSPAARGRAGRSSSA